MNDVEKIVIRVENGEIELNAVLEYDPDDKKTACHVGEILAKAIGREIGAAFKDDEEMAAKIAARLSYVILGEIAEMLEEKNGEES